MAVASLVLPVTAYLVNVFLLDEFRSILHMSQIVTERISAIIILVACISGLILGIRSVHSDKRRRMGIVGIVLNSIGVGVTSFFLAFILYAFH
jgi:hypothetical protein